MALFPYSLHYWFSLKNKFATPNSLSSFIFCFPFNSISITLKLCLNPLVTSSLLYCSPSAVLHLLSMCASLCTSLILTAFFLYDFLHTHVLNAECSDFSLAISFTHSPIADLLNYWKQKGTLLRLPSWWLLVLHDVYCNIYAMT